MRRTLGFTLVELLVATAMLGLLAAAGFAALSTGNRAAAKAKGYGAMIAHGQAALQALAGDLRAAVAQGDTRLTALDAQYDGLNSDTVDFIAVGFPKLDRGHPEARGRCEVGYSIENDPDTDVQWLVRREDSTLDDDPLEGGAVSLAGAYVVELDLYFYDGLYWQSGWDDPKEFPKLVSIYIVVADEHEIQKPMSFSTTVPILAE